MKKTLVLATSIALMIILFPASSFGAVKAGATCTKVGLTSIVLDKKYTCIKSGKKLNWDKGSSLIYPDGSGNPNPPIYPETEASRYIQKLIDSTNVAKSTNKTKIAVIVEPTTSSNGPYVRIAQEGVSTALNFYSALGMNIQLENLPIVLGRSKEWSRRTIAQYLPNQNIADEMLQGGFTAGGKLIYTNLVTGTIHAGNPPVDANLSNVIESSDWAADFAHETFHVFQSNAPTRLYDTFPIWVNEGSAQLFGYMTAAKLSKGKISYNQEVQKYLDWKHDIQRDCMGPIEEMQQPCNYSQGLFVAEYFVSKYGVNGLVKLLHNSVGASFGDQFLNATGDTLEKFYASANKQLLLRDWRNEVPAKPNSIEIQKNQGALSKLSLTDKLPLTTNLTISEQVQSVTLRWDLPSKVGQAIDFYRIHAECITENGSCGVYESDLWPRTEGGEADTIYLIPKTEFLKISDSKTWKFEIYSANNYFKFYTPSGNQVQITFTLK
jgi:hypothetical protein